MAIAFYGFLLVALNWIVGWNIYDLTPNRLRQSPTILLCLETRIDALTEGLGKGHSFGNRQGNSFNRKLLIRYVRKLVFQDTSVNKASEELGRSGSLGDTNFTAAP